MKMPLPPLLAKLDSEALLDRGGRPTLREFLSGLEFDPTEGTLRLNGRRLILQAAEADRLLHRALIRALGEEETRIFLLRHGYRLGLADAAFVEANWSGVDRGDAFTAGTRLHMFSGIVRVETVHNDFDFARGRFSGEFIWHNSIAATLSTGGAFTDRGQCWQQIGYASGYASHFFGALVVYKEVSCAAQGHRSCRVIGRLAEAWGENDSDVQLFRQEIQPFERRSARKEPARKPWPKVPQLLHPHAQRLETLTKYPLPWLIAGQGNLGQREAAQILIERLSTPSEAVLQRDATEIEAQELSALRRTLKPQVLWIERAELLGGDLQEQILTLLRQPPAGLRLILTSSQRLARIASSLFSPALWARLAPLASEMPQISKRDDRAAIIEERGTQIAKSFDLPWQEEFGAELPQARLADLDALDGAIMALLVAKAEGQRPDFSQMQGKGLDLQNFSEAMQNGQFSLPAHEAELRRMALQLAEGNLSAAARLLGISRAQLAYRETSKN